MSVGISIDHQLDIPPGLDTLDDFRRWVHSDDFPEGPRVHWIGGRLEIEMAADNVFRHSSPKTEIGAVLSQFVKIHNLGHVFIDQTLITMPAVDLSCEPDVVFVSHDAIAEGRVIPVPSRSSSDPDSIREIEGPPDLIVEIVSEGSVTKDTERLYHDYFEAGVLEYWLVDARRDELSLQLFGRGEEEFVPVKIDADGFQHSTVLNKDFVFSRRRDRNGLWSYDLAERA